MLGELAHLLAETRLGRRAIDAALSRDPEHALDTIGRVLSSRATLTRVEQPEEINGFEDLAFLFSSTRANHGVAGVTLVEGALLYRLARDVGGTVVEIGRYRATRR